MTTDQEQLVIPEAVATVLADSDPNVWVVLPAVALATQVEIALRETLDSRGNARPGLAAARLIRSLQQFGFTVSTKEPTP